jgi:hypothetical protein
MSLVVFVSAGDYLPTFPHFFSPPLQSTLTAKRNSLQDVTTSIFGQVGTTIRDYGT